LVKEVTAQEFAELIKGEKPVFVDFFATWCGPCKAMEPIIDRVAEEFAGRAEFVKIDIDKHGEIAVQNGVRGVPTFMIFSGGKAAERIVGLSSKDAVASMVAQYVGQDQSAGEPATA